MTDGPNQDPAAAQVDSVGRLEARADDLILDLRGGCYNNRTLGLRARAASCIPPEDRLG
jgi:hypothetical protein